MDLKIKSNAPEVSGYLGTVARKQLPFVSAVTATDLAKQVKRKEQSQIGKYFELRTNWLTKPGAMPIKYARKSDYPNAYATLRVKDEIAATAAVGGDRPHKGGKMAVPFSNTGVGRSTREILNPARKTLPRSKWPSKIVKAGRGTRSKTSRRKKPKPFFLQSRRTGDKYVAIRTEHVAYPLQILYGFVDRVDIPEQWPLIDNAKAYVHRNHDRMFRANLYKALLTAK